jgi:hypothetical protein
MKRTFATCVYSHCNIRNMQMKHLNTYTSETHETRYRWRPRPTLWGTTVVSKRRLNVAFIMDHAGIRGGEGSTASGGAPSERLPRWRQQWRSSGCHLSLRGAPAAGEGHGGMVSCPRRGAPTLENVAVSGGQKLWNLLRWSMAWCGDEECRDRRARRIEESASNSCFLIEKHGLVELVRCTGLESHRPDGRILLEDRASLQVNIH